MCLYPKLIFNKKYTNTKKNGGNIPAIKDMRTLYIPVECGNCIECRKRKTREWQVRLLEDIKEHTNGKFITLTFNNQSIKKLCEKLPELQGYTLDNAIATEAVKLFLGRYRKKYGRSLRHWLVTELGHNGTENIHLHGIIWPKNGLDDIEEIWSYGFVWIGKPIGTKKGKTLYENYVNERTIGYITKYVSKQDPKHQYYKSIILTSPGIGSAYLKNKLGDWTKNKFKGKETNDTYRTNTGHKMSLPIYYRNKIYTEEEKEQLWINKLNEEVRYVRGEKIDISKGNAEYFKIVSWHRKLNTELGYRGSEIDYDTKDYEEKLRIIKTKTRIEKSYKNKKFLEQKEAIKKIIDNM